MSPTAPIDQQPLGEMESIQLEPQNENQPQVCQPSANQAMNPEAPHPETTETRLRGGDRDGPCPGRFCFIIPCPIPCNFCFIPL